MDIKKLQTLVVDALEDVKAQDIHVYDTVGLTSLFDRIAIASGTSNRQTRALAASVRDKVRASGGDVISVEGEDTGEWVLVDLGDMVVHIMQPAIRAYYRLEEIWGEKELKLSPVKRGAKRAASDGAAADVAPKPVRRHVVGVGEDAAPAVARKSIARKTTKTASAPAGKTVKVPAKKSAVGKKAPAKRATAAKSGGRARASADNRNE